MLSTVGIRTRNELRYYKLWGDQMLFRTDSGQPEIGQKSKN